MTEAELKRALLKSLSAQDGEGFRIEDKYRLGVPDCLMLPADLPCFMIEAKILKGPRLVCTPAQAIFLERWHHPPRFLTAIIGWSESRGALYIGENGQELSSCRFVPRPNRLDSSEWLISELLGKWFHACKALDRVS